MPLKTDEKALPFAEAAPGATGLELLLSLACKWAQESGLSLPRGLQVVTSRPVGVLGAALGSLADSAGRLVEGGVADICVFDPQATWHAGPDTLRSQGHHTPFSFGSTRTTLPGRVRATLVAGSLAFDELPRG